MKHDIIIELQKAKSALEIRGANISDDKVKKIIKAINQAIVELSK